MQKPTFLPSEKEKKEKSTGISRHYPGHWILFLGLGSQLLTLQVGISLACWQLWLSDPPLGTATLQKDTDKLKSKSRKSSYNPNTQSVVLLSSVRPARASQHHPSNCRTSLQWWYPVDSNKGNRLTRFQCSLHLMPERGQTHKAPHSWVESVPAIIGNYWRRKVWQLLTNIDSIY